MSEWGIAIYLEARYQSWRRTSGHYNAIYGRRSFLLMTGIRGEAK